MGRDSKKYGRAETAEEYEKIISEAMKSLMEKIK